MRIQWLNRGLFAVVGLGVVAAVQAAPSDYTFTNVVNLTALGLQVSQPPIINNRGQVAFRAFDDKSNTRFIFRAEPGQLTTIVQNTLNDPTLDLGSMNDQGLVAFSPWGTDLYPQGVYVSDGVTTTPITERRPGQPGYDFSFSPGHPQINNAGTVVFGTTGGGESGFFAYKNGQISKIVSDKTFFSDFTVSALNDRGDVIFNGLRKADNVGGLFKVNATGGTPTLVVNENDFGSNKTLRGFSVNNLGAVAFNVQSTNSPFTAYTATTDGTGIKVIAASPADGIFHVAGGGTPSINDHGEVAFAGGLLVNGKLQAGLFNGSDPQLDRIIGTGDPLFGSTMAGLLQLDPNALNDLGQVAFIYGLADGTVGIAIATPVGVPEPAEISLLLGTVTLLGVRRERDRSDRKGIS